MKKLRIMLSGLLALLLLVGTASANSLLDALELLRRYSSSDQDLPTIDEVLSRLDQAEDKVEVSDNLDIYRIGNSMIEEYNGLKMIILERRNPKKEFTGKTYYAPLTGDEEGIPDDFTGVDIGEPEIWVRCDLMKQLPEIFRARSMKDANLLVIAESEYVLGGSLSVIDYEDSGSDTLPDFESVEEMEAYLASHQKVISSITFYPKFGVYDDVCLYKVGTAEVSLWDYQYTPAKRFARNPEADNQWYDMKGLDQVIVKLDSGDYTGTENAEAAINELDFVPQEKRDLWVASVSASESSTAVYSMNRYFWDMAEDLKLLDPSAKNREKYSMIIEAQNREALALFVSFCDYSGFDTPIKTIESSGEYMAKPDETWKENILNDILQMLNE